VQLAGYQQALDDAHLFSADFRPAKKPVTAFMETFA